MKLIMVPLATGVMWSSCPWCLWHGELLEIEAYFNVQGPDGELAYTEFRIGDYQHELGFVNNKYRPHDDTPGPAGAVVHWHVDDLDASIERLAAMGATVHEPRRDLTAGFATASVIDPFGNILGLMCNSHYLEILSELTR
jgi:predicted enzyme related to lactoylglutathione lyase